MAFRLLHLAFASIIAVAAMSFSASADVWYVNWDSPAGSSGDGDEWDEAFDDLQDALQKDPPPDEGDQIWVAQGTYATDEGDTEAQNPVFSTYTLVQGVAILGGFKGDETQEDQRDPQLYPTTLTGELATVSGNAKHVVTVGSGITDLTLLDGFIITGGDGSEDGAGIRCDGGYPVIRGCTITGNSGGTGEPGGGGIICSNAAGGTSDWMEFRNCLITDNDAGFGGGMTIDASGGDSRVLILNCRIQDNEATDSVGCGGGIYVYSKGAGAGDATVKIISSRIEGNSGADGGGALAAKEVELNDHVNVLLLNSVIVGNDADSGGGIYNDGGSLDAINCTISSNVAVDDGGGWYEKENFFGSNASEIRNSIVWQNVRGTSGSGAEVWVRTANARIRCSI